ncbi:transcriptional regulator [Sphaerochaeta pleomorpha str. Grapes]|uniref:Transcriptional regulator n=1 Tax=Sphaerochaeta pleomorpha (strain ATCC BAA-1885 / DSM 22778 / Grapes) TaxID=158190 RepID=G8QV04_SPHPG|nr:substrate-binding domain-containing protein [Sphaerochaeta pleomorpha]AEV29240.1 transcriptional regulator [Sphaerochaeta pleomorpha str. Grapes]
MRSTLNDIAQKANVSKVTVHKALHGKPGVSKETRNRILKIVSEMDYSINPMASSLKRETLKIALVYPELEPEMNFFFRQIKQGVDDAERKLLDFNVSLLRYTCGETWEQQAEILKQIAKENLVDGVVIYCWNDKALNPYFENLDKLNIPVVTFHSDAINSCRIASVTAPDEKTGNLAAEFMSQIEPDSGHILLLSGNTTQKVLRDNSLGFHAYLHENRPDLKIIEIENFQTLENLSETIPKLMEVFGDIKGIYCTNARNSISLCTIIENLHLTNIKIITTDVFQELKPYIDNGIVNGTIWQDPMHQAYDAIMLMFDFLTAHPFTKGVLTEVKIGIVMKNNFDCFLT